MHWFLKVPVGTNTYILKAELLFVNNQIEQIKVSGEGVSIVLESNRPLLEGIGLKKEITWKVIKGKLKDGDALKGITKVLEHSLQNQNELGGYD